jgi:hypothetical protein
VIFEVREKEKQKPRFNGLGFPLDQGNPTA